MIFSTIAALGATVASAAAQSNAQDKAMSALAAADVLPVMERAIAARDPAKACAAVRDVIRQMEHSNSIFLNEISNTIKQNQAALTTVKLAYRTKIREYGKVLHKLSLAMQEAEVRGLINPEVSITEEGG